MSSMDERILDKMSIIEKASEELKKLSLEAKKKNEETIKSLIRKHFIENDDFTEEEIDKGEFKITSFRDYKKHILHCIWNVPERLIKYINIDDLMWLEYNYRNIETGNWFFLVEHYAPDEFRLIQDCEEDEEEYFSKMRDMFYIVEFSP